jgi:hypothetical protein
MVTFVPRAFWFVIILNGTFNLVKRIRDPNTYFSRKTHTNEETSHAILNNDVNAMRPHDG